MDFFEAQARAKKRTSRLVVLFSFAVVGTIVGMYVAAILILNVTNARSGQRHRQAYGYYDESAYSRTAVSIWQPQLLGGVALATIAVVGLGSLFKWSQFSAGGKAVAESVGGRRVDPQTRDLRERRLLNVVEEMAIASGVAVPAVYILDEESAINAFAAGLTTNDAVVAVTRGTLEKLNRDELQGVIGHEFSHILNGDMRLNLRIASLIFGILVLGLVGRGILWSLRSTRVSSRDNKNSGSIVVVILLVGIALLIIGYVGYFFGRLMQAAVSRQREFLADASAVQFTRNPGGVSGALKKIGGYALGSSLQNNQSAAIGHFFFAQAFRSGITGLWATHPPLEERIRAIDPNFDGKFFEPPQVVDVEKESFASAGLAGSPVAQGFSAPPARTSPSGGMEEANLPPRLPTTAPLKAIAAIGVLTPDQLRNAKSLLDGTPERLRAAAQSPTEAPLLVYGLLLDVDATVRAAQRQIISARGGAERLRALDALEDDLRTVRDEQRLPLLQVAVPVLQQIPAGELPVFLETLDELVHADRTVTPFEFALQRILTHALALGRTPASTTVQYYSFNAVIDEIATVLSVMARASTADANAAPAAFAAGAAQIKLIESKLQYRDENVATLPALDAALDKLAGASLPIKQRTLVAAAHVVKADGQVLVCEFELLRAIAAALGVPMPVMTADAAAA